MTSDLSARAADLRQAAAALATTLHGVARMETTLACERAVLRLFGVSGLDRAGRPLAAEVVDRFAAGGSAPRRSDIALPFAVAAAEYELSPGDLALDVAAGNIDLALEAELLDDPGRRAQAEALVAGWVAGAWQRFDPNRTARVELLDLFGESAMPRFAVEMPGLRAGEVGAASQVVVSGGADLICVPVPADRELRRRLGEEVERGGADVDPTAAPAGSQRGLNLIRAALDVAAAQSGRYVRLATRSVGLAEPEQAIVAGFERIDAVFTDPLEAVVGFGVDPSRALADHAFAVALLARSGATLVLGPGPLAVAPEMTRGEPPDPPTRIGRALGLQALSVELSRAGGLPDDRIDIAGLSRELLESPASVMQGLVELTLRSITFPAHGLALEEPLPGEADPAWPIALTAWIGGGAAPALVMGRKATMAVAPAVREMRAAVAAGLALASARRRQAPTGEVAALASQALEVALATITELADHGWERLLGSAPVVGRRPETSSDDRGSAAGQVAPRAYLDLFTAAGDARLSA
ncbi:MAG: lysine 5,6-aminomutase subunit alpha TIM-barrel domain-containing protein [Candidatus Limnocylindrales bacterium]